MTAGKYIRTPETLRKMSFSHKGHIPTLEEKRKISESLKGIKRSEDTRRKMSIAKKNITDETRKKISKHRTGTHLSDKTKKLISINRSKIKNTWTSKALTGRKVPQKSINKRSGSNHFNWKGGITPINKQIRNSPEYKEWRMSVFRRDKWTCQLCFRKGIKLNADHIKQFSLYPSLRFDIDNGRTLCVPCHKTTDNFAGKIKRLIK